MLEAIIFESSVKHIRGREPGGGVQNLYRPAIEYTYIVNGITYTSDRTVIFQSYSGKKWAHRVVKGFPKNGKVKAFYNPDIPSKSFLYKQYIFFDAYGCILFSIPFIITALLMCRYYYG